MRIFWLFCALGALLGCRQVSEPSGQAIALFCSTYQGAKTESLTVGKEVAVFAGPEGTEDYFLEAAQFIVGSDGRSLTYGSTVYYPDPKQAVRFLAYFPYHTGTFSVPTDQSTATALKQADLCGATASSTPVATPVALAFEHLMARVVITTKEPTTRIAFPNAVASGVVHAATAEFVLGTAREDIWTESTTSKELIVPVQPLSRLVLTVSGVEYVFDGSVSLEAGRTTTLDLTLHPNTKTATLSGSSVSDWGSVNGEGNPTHAVSNTLLLHWPSLPQGAAPDQVIFTIGGTDYTVSNGITYANHTFTVPFISSVLRYPYTISKIRFYQSNHLVQSCPQLLGSMIYKSGYSTVGVNPNAVKIGNLWWATGNLVASNATAGARGEGGCRIGEPMDGGLYFQFGSLIGYKGGDQANGGTGVGMPQAPLTTNGTYWSGGAYSWASDAMVWPTGMVGTKATWTNTTGGAVPTLSDYYFNYSSGDWGKESQNIRDFSVLPGTGVGNLGSGRYATIGVGDPCTYYLGAGWLLPTAAQYKTLFDEVANETLWVDVDHWMWTSQGAGYFDPKTDFLSQKLFFPASGVRYNSNGSFNGVTGIGYGWSRSVQGAWNSFNLYLNGSRVYPQGSSNRSFGFPVRCVSDVAP